MKIITVVGARPQFIKAAAVSRKLRQHIQEVLVHTGQHYDANMSDVFFEELDIPKPDYNLNVGSGTHGQQTAEMLVKLEKIFLEEKPNYVLVYGDTNSTFAAALAASKLLIPVIHVEAGLRSFNMDMPEEQNRILTDHISKYLFCPTDTAVTRLSEENIKEGVYQIGDVMCDAVRYYLNKVQAFDANKFMDKLHFLFDWNAELDKWYMATVHRAENTRSVETLSEVLSAFEDFDAPVLFPVHPRIGGFVKELMKKNNYQNICFVEPLGYLEMLYFTSQAIKVVTDSGGLQKEAYMMHRNVVTLREQTEWVETLAGNHNVLCGINKYDILQAVKRTDIDETFNDELYGNGNAADKMIHILFGK